MKLLFQDFQVCAHCSSDVIKDFVSACSSITGEFEKGVYFLQGEIDSGAWAFCSSLLQQTKLIYYDGKIFIDDKRSNLNTIRKSSICIGDYTSLSFSDRFNPCQKTLKKALLKSNLSISYENLCQDFDFPAEFWNRNPGKLGGIHIWKFTAMLGIALNKKVFISSWIGRHNFQEKTFENLIHNLLNYDCIVLIPSSDFNVLQNSFQVKYIKIYELYQKPLYDKYVLGIKETINE